jgi:hypothetical protein
LFSTIKSSWFGPRSPILRWTCSSIVITPVSRLLFFEHERVVASWQRQLEDMVPLWLRVGVSSWVDKAVVLLWLRVGVSSWVDKAVVPLRLRGKKNCNCRRKDTCPMDGNCQNESIIYQAEVSTTDSKETYIGLCDTTFKLRHSNHKCSFNNETYGLSTELSKYIWSLKDKKINYNIKWRKIINARSYTNVSKKCNLCLWEKFFIICKPQMATLNKRSELMSGCRHSNKFSLSKFSLSKSVT